MRNATDLERASSSDQRLGSRGPRPLDDAPMALLAGAVWFGFCSLLAGLIMTGLLPFIERMFDVQTDISLLELVRWRFGVEMVVKGLEVNVEELDDGRLNLAELGARIGVLDLAALRVLSGHGGPDGVRERFGELQRVAQLRQ